MLDPIHESIGAEHRRSLPLKAHDEFLSGTAPGAVAGLAFGVIRGRLRAFEQIKNLLRTLRSRIGRVDESFG
jgi:hypothetical protein